MAINLPKGQTIDLRKNDRGDAIHDLSTVTIGLGWDVRKQESELIENAFIRAVDASGNEITKYSLSGDATLNGMCSMVFSEVYRKDDSWKFKALGDPYQTDSFVELLKKYM